MHKTKTRGGKSVEETKALDRLKALSDAIDDDLKDSVEDVVVAAGKYVSAVTTMECMARNYAGRTGTDRREAVEQSDKARTIAHNSFISAVDLANRIAASEGLPPIYTGGPERREYGDFALEIVDEIFKERT